MAPPLPGPTSHHGRPIPSRATVTFTKQRYLWKNLRHTYRAFGSSGSVFTLDSISEDEESECNEDFDKDLVYEVRVDPTAPLGDEAALLALFAEDPDDEGIQGNFAIPGENSPTEGKDGRRNGTNDGDVGNSPAQKIPPQHHHSPSCQLSGSTSHTPPSIE